MSRPLFAISGAIVVALLAGCSDQAADPDAVHDDWCERAATSLAAYDDLDDGSGSVSGDDAITDEEYEVMAPVFEDPLPEPIADAAGLLRGDIPAAEEPIDAYDQIREAAREITSYAEDECGITVR